MKISNDQRMTGVVKGKSGAVAQPAGKAVSQSPDRVALSGGNEEIGRLSALMQQIPDNSTQMVPQLKQLIGDGTYHAESRDVAERMLDRWQDFAAQ
jgi:flagellar biosynthesis anti-sigma factor FlgM